MYFKDFQNIYYEYDINGQPVLKVVKDVTTNVRFRKAILENVTLYDEYDVKEGETPEIIASKIYGSSEYHWVIMLCNQKFDNIADFPMSYHVLEDYIRDKYGDTVYDVKHYVNSKGFVVPSDTIGATPVTNYDYEVSVNDSKRRIKLISPDLLGQIIENFKKII